MSLTERGLRALQTRGVQRGVLGSSRGWFWIAVVSFVLRRLRKMAGGEPEVVFRGELKPGEVIQIDHRTELVGGGTARRGWRRRG
jgi:hypothetical protein